MCIKGITVTNYGATFTSRNYLDICILDFIENEYNNLFFYHLLCICWYLTHYPWVWSWHLKCWHLVLHTLYFNNILSFIFCLFVRIIINLCSTIYTTNYNYKTTLHSKWFLSHHFDKMWDNKMSKVNSDKKDPYEFRYYP